MSKGKKNLYKCSSCGYEMITIDIDEGVTPFMEICEKCKGEMRSSFYRCDQNLEPTHEWYKPTLEDLIKNYPNQNAFAGMMEHVENGGLDLRRIENDEWKINRVSILADLNESLNKEAIGDVIAIAKLNDSQTAFDLLKNQFIIINKQDIINE